MKNAYLVAVIAGLAAAALYATVGTPTVVGALLFNLAALPLFVAGLGFGVKAAAAGGLVGALALALANDWRIGLLFAATAAAAPVVLTSLALKHRQAAATPPREGEVTAGGLEWYPEGRIVLWAAALATALMVLTLLVGGGDAESFRAAIRDVAHRVGTMVAGEDAARAQDLAAFADLMVIVIPLAAAVMWHVATMACFWLAARIVTLSGSSLRPWAAFGAMRFPPTSVVALLAASLAALLPGLAGFAGSLALAAMTSAFMLLGLAVVHGLTAGIGGRGLILASLYVALLVLNWLLVPPLVALALADMVFGLRARANRPPPPATT